MKTGRVFPRKGSVRQVVNPPGESGTFASHAIPAGSGAGAVSKYLLALADKEVTHQGGNEQDVCHPPGYRQELRLQLAGIANRSGVVREQPIVETRRLIAQAGVTECSKRSVESEGQQLEGHGGHQCPYHPVRRDDHDVAGRCDSDDLLPNLSASALDQPTRWANLVRPIDGDIEVVDAGEGPHVGSEAAGGVEGDGRGHHRAGVEVSRCEGGQQVGDGRSGAEPDDYACFRRFSCRFSGEAFLGVDRTLFALSVIAISHLDCVRLPTRWKRPGEYYQPKKRDHDE